MDRADYPFKEVGSRPPPDIHEALTFARSGTREAGRRTVPAAARAFHERSATEVEPYPPQPQLPKWVLALVEKKVSADEFARTVYERTLRAPSAENQRLALLLANEVARQPDGAAILERYLTPELLRRLSAEGHER